MEKLFSCGLTVLKIDNGWILALDYWNHSRHVSKLAPFLFSFFVPGSRSFISHWEIVVHLFKKEYINPLLSIHLGSPSNQSITQPTCYSTNRSAGLLSHHFSKVKIRYHGFHPEFKAIFQYARANSQINDLNHW
jgi:hypothetical protein